MSFQLPPASDTVREAYRQFAGTCGLVVMADLEEQIPGDFCPENQYVTAHNLGMMHILRILALRVAETMQPKPSLPEQTTNG